LLSRQYSSLPETPDVAIILVGTDQAIKAVQELSKINTPVAIVLTSGFIA
jgi:acyl-CoA synthetase (NDP forming)